MPLTAKVLSPRRTRRTVIIASTLAALLAIPLLLQLILPLSARQFFDSPPDQQRQLLGTPCLPDTLTFAGEEVPLHYADVRESLDWELCVAANWHSHILIAIKRANRYFPTIEPILKAHSVPDDFKYLAVAESTLYDLAISPSQAVGIWQFLKSTAQEYGLTVNEEVDERYHLEKATHAACLYLKKSYAEHKSWAMAAAAYNMGPNGVRRQSERQLSNSYYNLVLGTETGRYLFRIMALKLVMEHPETYGFSFPQDMGFPSLKYKTVDIDSTVNDLARFAQEQGCNYKTLKWLNPWLRSNTLTVEPGKFYTVKILTDEQREEAY